MSGSRLNFADTAPHDFGFRAPQDHPVHGIDASRHQPQIDWRTARANGVTFAWLKATEGGDILDPAFRDNWRAARRNGVAHGAYHFYYHCRPAAEQARWFIRHVPREAGALPPVLDLEWTPFSPTCTIRRPASVIRSEARIFLQAIESHYGQRPLIYTSIDFYRDTAPLLERLQAAAHRAQRGEQRACASKEGPRNHQHVFHPA